MRHAMNATSNAAVHEPHDLTACEQSSKVCRVLLEQAPMASALNLSCATAPGVCGGLV
eukprot:CAMPEP_0180525008 /NCGR_PEP_ID=MMETSP1036_2-20121128/58933_1 /TAXON_ID=632150 /ORGANISM="Azadinium spinosum, Strain 3D9" /LENGTH=57 /DNA_ID=CAMNT_0022538267 /DNA_START=66 /DNA_END=238 /DNA_ORIENTATION=-